MASQDESQTNADRKQAPSLVRRALWISLALAGLILAGLAIASFLSADPATLPFDYDGFD